ncbi:uncharacterized protein [Halyomorpha halys]|uniref:uncharacterized protein n=1 Tax=Halyomorpha halys TaxID=286706 RepID=UPI0006D4FCF5|nr:uncharacterized protein LOC106689787 [Halyomorpha halys]
MDEKAKTWYRSIYKCDYKWPPIYKRTVPEVIVTSFPEHCKDLSPKKPCACASQFCICKQKRYTKEDPAPEFFLESELEAQKYLQGVKSLYQDTYSPDGPKEDQSVLPTDLCPKPRTPSTRIWNPYLVPRDAYRPGLPKPLGCPLTFESVTKPVHYSEIKKPHQSSLKEIEALLQFPCTLQEKISVQNMKAQKIGISRERPASSKRIF